MYIMYSPSPQWIISVDPVPSEEKRDDETMVNSAVEALEKLFVESLSKGLQNVLTDANEKAFETGKWF